MQRVRIGRVIFPLILTSVSLLLPCAMCGRCTSSPSKPPERYFELEDLFINETAFPDHWVGDPDGPSEACRAAPLNSGCRSYEAKVVFFRYDESGGGGAFEEIHRYVSVAKAAGDFARFCADSFSGNEYSTRWRVPDELPYQSPVADQFRFACNTHGSLPYCQMVGQYEEFIVQFHTHKRVISYQDLDQVLQSIDERMASFLEE